jgi:glutathione S-transferase
MWQFAFPAVLKIANPATAEPYEKIKYQIEKFPRNLSEEDRKIQWANMEKEFGLVDGWLSKNEGNSPFLLGGDVPCYGDIVLAGYILWLRLIWGDDSEEWKQVSAWHNGRWGKLLKGLEKYEVVH